MGIDLAYLTIDRAPYKGRDYAALLVMAIDADDRDVVKMSHATLAWQARFERSHAQEAIEKFEAAGILTRFTWGDKRNPFCIFFQFHRSVLAGMPRRSIREPKKSLATSPTLKTYPRRIAGMRPHFHEARIQSTLQQRAREAAERLAAFAKLREGQHLAFLRSTRT